MTLLRRRGWRGVLSALMVLVSLVVSVRGAVEERELQGNGWDRRYVWTTPDPVMQVYGAVNLPAICVAFLPLAPYAEAHFDWAGWRGVLLLVLLALWLAVVTAFVWFYLGRWVDRQLGWLPPSEWKGSWVSVIGAGIGVAQALLIAVVVALARARELAGMAGWIAFAAVAMGMQIRRVLPGLRKGYSS